MREDEFPPLSECRESFTRLVGQAINWSGPEDWLEGPQGTTIPKCEAKAEFSRTRFIGLRPFYNVCNVDDDLAALYV